MSKFYDDLFEEVIREMQEEKVDRYGRLSSQTKYTIEKNVDIKKEKKERMNKMIDVGEQFVNNEEFKVDKNTQKKIIKGVIITVITIVVITLLFGSFTTINSGEVGIRLRFGKVVNTEMREGLNFKIPIIEKIVKMNIKVQKQEVITESSSKDLQLVNMALAVNYRVDGTKAIELFKNVGTKYGEVVLQPAVQESIKAVTSRYTAEELITRRNEVSVECMDELNNKVNRYGIIIDNFNITNFNFSTEFNNAIEEKQVAEQRVLTAKQELEKSKVEAERKVVEAQAEKKANELKQQSLTDNVIKAKFIEKWDGQLPKASNGNSIIDISELLK